jgi:hypothetical protein
MLSEPVAIASSSMRPCQSTAANVAVSVAIVATARVWAGR